MPDYKAWVSDPAFIVVVSGPSGVGKSSFCHAALAADERICYSVSATTRPRRGDEREGREYLFVSPAEFERMRGAGELVEWAEVHGSWYGTPRRYLESKLREGRIIILDVDVQGGLAIKREFPDSVLIFILPPSLDVLERRLRGRQSDAEEVIARRLAVAPAEIAHAVDYDYVVVNDELEAAIARVLSIVEAEKSRRERCYRPAADSRKEGGTDRA